MHGHADLCFFFFFMGTGNQIQILVTLPMDPSPLLLKVYNYFTTILSKNSHRNSVEGKGNPRSICCLAGSSEARPQLTVPSLSCVLAEGVCE